MVIVLFRGEVGHGQIWGTFGNMPVGIHSGSGKNDVFEALGETLGFSTASVKPWSRCQRLPSPNFDHLRFAILCFNCLTSPYFGGFSINGAIPWYHPFTTAIHVGVTGNPQKSGVTPFELAGSRREASCSQQVVQATAPLRFPRCALDQRDAAGCRGRDLGGIGPGEFHKWVWVKIRYPKIMDG